MKIKFLLDGGATVTLELEYLSEVQKALQVTDGPMWLWDKHGAGVNLAKVCGFTAVEQELPGQTQSPRWVKDDGDCVWRYYSECNGYHLTQVHPTRCEGGWSVEQIKESYGISERG